MKQTEISRKKMCRQMVAVAKEKKKTFKGVIREVVFFLSNVSIAAFKEEACLCCR